MSETYVCPYCEALVQRAEQAEARCSMLAAQYERAVQAQEALARQVEAMQTQLEQAAALEAATIERCAQVADDFYDGIAALVSEENAAANIAIAIRALRPEGS